MVSKSIDSPRDWLILIATLWARSSGLHFLLRELRSRGEVSCPESPRGFLEVWATNPHLPPKPGSPMALPLTSPQPKAVGEHSNAVVVGSALASGSLYPADVCPSPGHTGAPLDPSWYAISSSQPSILSLAETPGRRRHWGNAHWKCRACSLCLDIHLSADTSSAHLVGMLGCLESFWQPGNGGSHCSC